MTKAEFEQEYLASFTTFEGQIYTDFKQDYVIDELPSTIRGEAIAGCDPGYRDATAWINIVYDFNSDIFYIVEDYLEAERSTSEHAKYFSSMIERWRIEIVFIDSAAAQFASDLAYSYNIATTRAKKDVLPGILYIQTLIKQGKLLVVRNCTHVLAMLDQYRWDDRETLTREKPKHDQYSHIADALRYALYTYTV